MYGNKRYTLTRTSKARCSKSNISFVRIMKELVNFNEWTANLGKRFISHR